MKFYLDNCCYNRPYDNREHMAQASVRAEVIAILTIVEFCRLAGHTIFGSVAVKKEIKKIQHEVKLEKVLGFYDRTINDYIPISAAIAKRARELREYGLKALDSFHLAFAEAAGVDFLLTTDVRFEHACAKIKLTVKVLNPLNFIPEVMVWAL